MIHFIKMRLAQPERQPVHINTAEIVTIQPEPNGGSIVELTTGKSVVTLDSPEDILSEIHSR